MALNAEVLNTGRTDERNEDTHCSAAVHGPRRRAPAPPQAVSSGNEMAPDGRRGGPRA